MAVLHIVFCGQPTTGIFCYRCFLPAAASQVALLSTGTFWSARVFTWCLECD